MNMKRRKRISALLDRLEDIRIDLEELKEQIPDYQNYIERLSAYMQSKKKSYTDHAATILSWAQRDHAVRPARTYTFKEGESL